jgi:2,4-dienoyl-CoA reductase-like NADH-dependent reductase (Old Yellow Enzyme family)
MSVLFSTKRIGSVEIENRFVAAAIYEGMATDTGEVTDKLVNKYCALAKGGVGLIITGYMFVNSAGRQSKFQTSISDDRMIPRLKNLAEVIHEQEGKCMHDLKFSIWKK